VNKVCLYHRSDLDGKCSGAIVNRHVPNIQLLGIDYGDTIPWYFLHDAEVYLVDFSLQPWSEMQRLAETARKVIWIDHHKSAMEEQTKSPISCQGHQDSSHAACELCWSWFNRELGVSLPRVVWLLGRYDVWNLDAHEDILPFQMGMRLNRSDPCDAIWDVLFEEGAKGGELIHSIVREGRTVLDYQARTNESLMGKSFEHRWRELNFLAVNAGGINSKAFDSKFDSNKHDAVMSFYYAGDQRRWTVSLYSPDKSRDLSGIAKEMGGGGHAAACGFQVKSLGDIGLTET